MRGAPQDLDRWVVGRAAAPNEASRYGRGALSLLAGGQPDSNPVGDFFSRKVRNCLTGFSGLIRECDFRVLRSGSQASMSSAC